MVSGGSAPASARVPADREGPLVIADAEVGTWRILLRAIVEPPLEGRVKPLVRALATAVRSPGRRTHTIAASDGGRRRAGAAGGSHSRVPQDARRPLGPWWRAWSPPTSR